MAESRRSGGTVAGAIVVGLALVGAGVGIGAAIWSGGSDARTVTVTPQANAADENAPPASGNFAQTATIHVQYDTGEDTVPMKLSQGQPTNCTRDETYGSFAMANKGTKQISMWVKNDKDEGSCYTQAHWNTWNVELPGPHGGRAGGRLWMRNDIHTTAPVHRYQKGECRDWPGTGIAWSCRADVNDLVPGGHVDFYLTYDGD